MNTIYLVTTSNGFFAQKKMPWSSMDINEISKYLSVGGYDVRIVNFDYVKNNFKNMKNSIVLYTSSQRVEHKKYIEDLIYLLSIDNLMIPSYESLLAHDNKGFQIILDKKYGLNLIESDYYIDVDEIDESQLKFPYVFKPANGASAHGVTIVDSLKALKKVLEDEFSISKSIMKKKLKKYIFKNLYNSDWEKYISFGKRRFVLQKFLPGMTCDYKVLIFGDKFYILKRFTKDNDFRASGSGIHDTNIPYNEVELVLNEAKRFRSAYHSHIYSLDICIFEGETHLIEFQFTHIGPVTLTESHFYYTFEDGVWKKNQSHSNLEREFSNSVLRYINESCALRT